MNLLFGKINWFSNKGQAIQESHTFYDGRLELCIERIHNFSFDHKTFSINNESKLLCAIIGYISNLTEIKATYSLTGEHDVDVVGKLYSLKGPGTVSELDGIFSIFIWDENKQRAYLFQDEYGSNLPMYYTYNKEECIFSTSLKRLLHRTSFTRKLNLSAAYDFLYTRRVIPHEETLLTNVMKLLPKQYIVMDVRKCSIKTHRLDTKEKTVSVDFAKTNLISSISGSVKDIVGAMSHKGATCALSGGFDTNLILHFLRQFSKGSLKAVTIGGKEANEIPVARKRVQKYKNVEHRAWLVIPDRLNCLADIVWRNEGYICEQGLFLGYELAMRLAEEGTKAVFLGDCADQQLESTKAIGIIQIQRKIKEYVKGTLFADAYYAVRGLTPQRSRRFSKGFKRASLMIRYDVAFDYILKKNGILLNSYGIEGIYPFLNRKTKTYSRSLGNTNAGKRYYVKEVKRVLGEERSKDLRKRGGSTDIEYLFKDSEHLVNRLLRTELARKLIDKRQVIGISRNPQCYLEFIFQLLFLNLFKELFITCKYDYNFDNANIGVPLMRIWPYSSG